MYVKFVFRELSQTSRPCLNRTGLYAESHGIVANVLFLLQLCVLFAYALQNFWDPVSREEFHYNRISSAWNPMWWLGEPVCLILSLTVTLAEAVIDVGNSRKSRGCYGEFNVVCNMEAFHG